MFCNETIIYWSVACIVADWEFFFAGGPQVSEEHEICQEAQCEAPKAKGLRNTSHFTQTFSCIETKK